MQNFPSWHEKFRIRLTRTIWAYYESDLLQLQKKKKRHVPTRDETQHATYKRVDWHVSFLHFIESLEGGKIREGRHVMQLHPNAFLLEQHKEPHPLQLSQTIHTILFFIY
jgi:hypothetical protein